MDLIDSLVRYVKEIKPYHTKIYGVDVEYRTRDDVNVTIDEDLKLNVWLGVPIRDMTKFNWTLEDLNFPTDINLVPFLRSRGAYISPQSLWDKNYPTDAGLDGGIIVLNTTVRSFIVKDDLRFIFEKVTTFEVNDQDGVISGDNNGWFTVDYVSYNPNTNTTEIVVLESLTEGVTTNRILLSDWDGIAWDSSLLIDEDAYRKAGLMYENVAVSFSEELLFTFQSIPAVDRSVVGHPWDQYLEGIDILEYTSTSIILQGDATIPLTVLSTFEVVGSDLNDGTYGVLSFTYDPILDRTTVVVTIGPDASGTGGKAKFGLWEGLEWDGKSYYYFHTPPPKADMCAKTGIGEDFVITLGFGWDDNRDGGWDSGLNGTSWDYAIQERIAIESPIDMPTHIPVITNPTDDEHWQNDPSNSIPYTWNDTLNMWEPVTLGAVWEFALTPKQQPYNWSKGLRASLLRVTLDPGPNLSHLSFLLGNVILFDVAGNQVGFAPFEFTDLDEPITVDVVIDNNTDHDYSRLLVETTLNTTGLRISYIEFDPQ